MSKVRTFNSPILWVSFRVKNPWKPRKPTPPDDVRCKATTLKGARCKQPGKWQGNHRPRNDYCSWHQPKPIDRFQRKADSQLDQPKVDETLPDDPAEWLASLGDLDEDEI